MAFPGTNGIPWGDWEHHVVHGMRDLIAATRKGTAGEPEASSHGRGTYVKIEYKIKK